MGTHPIFESDFDCLTGKFMSDDLKTLLSNLVLDRNQPISGLLAITVIDRQGVPIIKPLDIGWRTGSDSFKQSPFPGWEQSERCFRKEVPDNPNCETSNRNCVFGNRHSADRSIARKSRRARRLL